MELDRGATAILPRPEQAPHERYFAGQARKVVVLEVRRTLRGPQIIVSRAHKALVKRLFELEVPEIFHGQVEIVGIAREPGSRTKIAVRARQPGLDARGACIGQRGLRVQAIVNELGGEKIDIIEWAELPERYVANALEPAHVVRVDIVPEEKTAYVIVPDRQLSLAIGKEGQNARLAPNASSCASYAHLRESFPWTSAARPPDVVRTSIPIRDASSGGSRRVHWPER